MSETPSISSADAVSTLLGFLGEIESRARERGYRHYRDGRVGKINSSGSTSLHASVHTGFHPSFAQLHRTPAGWQSRCTCQKPEHPCEHVAALASAWLEHLRAPKSPPPRSSDEPAAPTARKPTLSPFRQQWEPILAAKLGRPLAPEEGAFLGQLASVFHNFRQSGRVSGNEILRLGFSTREVQRGFFHTLYDDWWPRAPADPMELWQYIAHDIETSGLVIPEFMLPVTDTTAAREHLRGRERRKEVARWKEKLDHLVALNARPVSTASDSAPAATRLELRLRIEPKAWTLETRSDPAAAWTAASASFTTRFTRGSPEALSDIESTPAVYVLLALLQSHYQRHYVSALNPGATRAAEFLHRAVSHRLVRTLLVGAGGEPITLAPDPLVWSVARTRGYENNYQLTLCLPDGETLPADTLYLPGQPDLYLVGSTVHRGPTPIDHTSPIAVVLPAEALMRPAVLQMLRRRGAQLPREIEERIDVVPMKARFECELATEYADNEILRVELFAQAEKPAARRSYTPRGWTELEAAADATSSGERLVLFDLTQPDEAAARLADLKLAYSEYDRYWARRLTRNVPEEFIAWREKLPPWVDVFATGELASLLGAPVRASVDFSLIESNVHRDWFDLALALKPEDTTLTPEEIALLLKARGRLVRLPGKGWRRLSVQLDGAPAAALEAAGFDPDSIAEAALAGERHRFHALQLAQSAMSDLLPQRQAEALRARAQVIVRPEPPAVPAGLRAELRPYQIEGFHFLAFLSANQLGGVLADDMGLGKTVQTLAWLLWLADRRPADEPLRVLVVCPKSVVGNWEAETARFAPALQTLRFKPALIDAPPAATGHRLVIANYTQLRLAAEHFAAQRWHAVILDEGQFIKTPSSKVAQIARELPGEHRLILTGTPIENRLLDLWSLFSFSLPGLLGSQAAFKRQYAGDNPLALTRLRSRVRHFLLRRTKTQVASDLPARTEEDVLVDLEGDQRKLYNAELKRARTQLLKVETARQFDQARFNILASLLRLRQICCHPILIDSAHHEAPSAKLEELLERIESLRDEGHQVLVFSQFVTMLEVIRDKLAAAGIGHLMLTGQTEDRDTLVRQFQSDRKHAVFLLSLKAAGFGLNLTAASYVILFDPWWNPAVEAQAIDRTHRIGQSAPVNAYRFIARGTIEEKIRALQREKSALAGAIVQEESLASVLDLDSLRQILA